MINILKLRKMQKSGGVKPDKEEKLPAAEPVKEKAAEPAAENSMKKEIPSAKIETVSIPELIEDAVIPAVQNPENLMSGLPKVDIKTKEPEKPITIEEPKPVPAAMPAKVEEAKKIPVQEVKASEENKKEDNSVDIKKDVLEEIIQLVGFNLGAEYYGVEITRIREIIRMVSLTRVPRTPAFIEGVINLRGSVLPVVNLRTKVKMPKKEYDKSSRIIVVDLNGIMVGFIVDNVQEVIRIPKSATQPPPDIITGVDGKFFTAVANLNNQLLIILDIEKVLMNDEKKDAKKVA